MAVASVEPHLAEQLVASPQGQVHRRVSNLSIHPEEQPSILLVDELRRGSQVQCNPGRLYDHRVL